MRSPQEYIGENLETFKSELLEFLRIPSISTSPDHLEEVQEAASWLKGMIEQSGLQAEIHQTPGHPIVLGEWREAGNNAPTVLVYGHYDVQPPEPLDLWNSPPFEPEIRNGRLYGRGSADDKGQLYLHLKAAEAFLKGPGNLPVNLILLIEGEEEVGSPNLLPFVESQKDRLSCDVTLISDTSMIAPGLPSILCSLRGLAYFDIEVRGPSSDLHSGVCGGPVVNPALALAQILASLQNPEGEIAIDHFYDDIVEWPAQQVEALKTLPFDKGDFEESIGRELCGGEQQYTVLERLWTRPTVEVNGLNSGYTGEGAKTVLPSVAQAKVSFRLVSDQTPERIEVLFRQHVEQVTPKGVEVTIRHLHGGMPWRSQLNEKLKSAVDSALTKVFDKESVIAGEGGSIPIVNVLEKVLESPVLLLGFSYPGCNLHAPNEWFPEENIENGIRTIAHLYQEFSSVNKLR